jgi:hypothetical protein
VQKDCIDRVRAVRSLIDKLPADERAWVLLRLNDGMFACDALVTENELVGMCKRLGPDKLLLALQRKVPSDDPDLQRGAGMGLILRHADELLRPTDGDALLACERSDRDSQKHGHTELTVTAGWAVAAARLQPEKASAILHAAMERFQGEFQANDRSYLCVALWQLAGERESQYLLDWLYGEAYPHKFFPGCRSTFIDSVGKDQKGRKIIARIIQDPRFDNLDRESLVALIRIVNGWLKKPLVPEEEIRKASRPFGQETEEVRKLLAEWRGRLRASVPQWLP